MNPLKILILIVSLHVIISAKVINIDNIVNDAIRQDRQVLLFFHMTYCGACKKMKRDTIDNPYVNSLINKNFSLIRMNINDDDTVVYKDFKGSIHQFARSLDVYLYPSTMFIGTDNNIKHHLVGFRDKDKFLTVLDYVITKSYEKMTLDTFINEKDFNE
ncbi:MAG: thioredoxin fold domain-containing protein [Sulfurimonadaceae bacterium]